LLRPSNTLQDAMLVSVNAAMGASVAVAVLLLSPGVGAELAFAQGIAAVSTAVFPLLVVVLSGRALRWLRNLLQRGNVPLEPSLSCYPRLLGDDVDSVELVDAAEDWCENDLLRPTFRSDLELLYDALRRLPLSPVD
jgi:hypothetical protein